MTKQQEELNNWLAKIEAKCHWRITAPIPKRAEILAYTARGVLFLVITYNDGADGFDVFVSASDSPYMPQTFAAAEKTLGLTDDEEA